jgi:cob(I)alamin adenosyltransferase
MSKSEHFPWPLATDNSCKYIDRVMQKSRIYTKTGDKGDTSLFGGQRVPKDALRIEAYGTVDELNAVLGIARAESNDPALDKLLAPIQERLFSLGADLATPRAANRSDIRRIQEGDAAELETSMDALDPELKPLKSFILPGGSLAAAHLHHARTVCRRAERIVVRLSRNEDIGEGIQIYLNRLSDLLFILARYVNHKAGVAEIKWKP